MSLKFINEDTGALKEVVFCFTGKSTKTRPEMEAIAINAGAQVTKSVNGRTTILVIADANSMSCKAESARDRGIDLISPSQFFEICGEVGIDKEIKSVNLFKITKPKPVTQPSEKRKHSSIRQIQL